MKSLIWLWSVDGTKPFFESSTQANCSASAVNTASLDRTHLGDPDGFPIGVPVIINVLLDSGHVELVDVDGCDVPHRAAR